MNDQSGKPGKIAGRVKLGYLGRSRAAEPTSTDLATDRTIMAADRTLMAWQRTAISLISFGFTLFKFLNIEIESRPGVLHDEAPRNVGLTMVGLGLAALTTAIIQYRRYLMQLGVHEMKYLWSISVIFSLLFWIVGMWLFVSILIA